MRGGGNHGQESGPDREGGHGRGHRRTVGRHPRGWTHAHSYRGRRWGPWHRRRASLRRRLTIAFALVALGAVALTTWSTIGAVAEVQRGLSSAVGGARDADLDPAAAEAFRHITRTAFRAGALSFVIAVVAAGAFTNYLTRPLHALTRGARRLEAGERGIRLTVPAGRDELVSLTEAFNALVEGLERQEAWRRDMTADIAHDLRTPLAVLLSEIEAMQDGVVPSDQAGLGRLHREVMLLARLVDDLRTLSVSDAGGLSLVRGTVAVAPLLERSLAAFGSRAAEAGAELRLLPTQPGLSANIDADRISQVVGNLLDNALRHAGGVPIEVGAEAVTLPAPDEGNDASERDVVDAVRVWVRDRGPGLPTDSFEQVFERFYRVDDARGGRETGSGLGLAIARAIVEAHGGSIAAHNHPEGGAVFELYLPATG